MDLAGAKIFRADASPFLLFVINELGSPFDHEKPAGLASNADKE